MSLRLAPALVVGLGLALAVVAEARPVPVLKQRVTDQAGAISVADARRLEEKLAAYERATGHQLAVLIVPDLDGEPLEAFSMRAVEAWKLGDETRDDGVLLLVALEERALRIEVGYGLEGAIPDALAGRIIRDVITPRFRQGDIAGGIDAGLDQLMRAAEGESVGAPAVTSSPPATPHLIWVAFIILLVVLSMSRRRGLRAVGLAGLIARGGFGGGLGGGGGGFSGGGGSFGGGGASGRW